MEKPKEHEGNPTVDVEKPKKSPKLDEKKFIRVHPPDYERELSIYEQTTLEKINNFRAARSQWISKREEKQKIFTDDTEGVKDSHLYTGRCSWIRKLGRKNSLLREHYHGLRPLRYWTLKRKAAPYDENEELNKILKDLKAERAKKEKFQDPCQEVSLWTKEDEEECQQQVSRLKGKKAQKMKKKECQEKRAKGPCKMALKRLKEAKLSEGLLESCKCDAGREVTVVIKGFCLCDQTALTKIDLSKVCDGYQKKDDFIPSESKSRGSDLTLRQMGKLRLNEEDLEKKEPPPKDQRTVKVETKPTVAPVERKLDLSDSLDLTRKKIEAIQKHEETVTHEPLKEEAQKEEVSKTENESETSFIYNRRVTFKNDGNLKGDGGGTRYTPSDLTLFKKLSSESAASDHSFPKGKMQEVPAHALHEHEVPTTSDSLRTLLESKKYAKQMPDTDSMNNLLSNEDGGTLKVNFRKKHKKMEVENYKPGTKNGSSKRKLSNLAVNKLSSLSSSFEIHKKHVKTKESELETKSSSLKDLTKDKDSKKKNEKPAPKVRLNPIPKVISIDEVPFLNEHDKEKEKEMPATGDVQKTPEKIIQTNSENTQDGFDNTWDEKKPVEPFSTAVYGKRDNEQDERSLKVEDAKFTISEPSWEAEKPPPETEKEEDPPKPEPVEQDVQPFPKALHKTIENEQERSLKMEDVKFTNSEPPWAPVHSKDKRKEELEPRGEQSEENITGRLLKRVYEEEHTVPPSDIEVEKKTESIERKVVVSKKFFEEQRAKGSLTRKETKGAGPQGNEEEEDKESGGILLELEDGSEKDLTPETEGLQVRDDASMITLYKNNSGVKSELGLTKEELMKMRIMGMNDTESADPLKTSVTDVKSKITRELPNLK